MTVTVDLSELTALADDLAGVPSQVRDNCAAAVAEFAPLILADQQNAVPIGATGDLYATLAIDWVDESHARIGSVQGNAKWRAHFTEDGTATQSPQPFVGPAGERYAEPFYEAVVFPSIWPR